MLRALYLCLILIGYSLPLAAQVALPDLSVARLDSTLLQDAMSVVRYSNYGYEVSSDHSATKHVLEAITIFDPDSRENELTVHYDSNQKITRFKASIYNALGDKVREAKKAEIEDVMAISGGQFYTDSRVKTVTMEHATYPYTVVFDYEVRQTDFGVANFPFWLPYGIAQSCVYARFSARIPTDLNFMYDLKGLAEPVVTTAGNQTTYTWEVKDQTALKHEPYAPTYADWMPVLKTQLETFRISSDHVVNYSDWSSFGETFQALREGKTDLPTPLKAEIQSITALAESEVEKIDMLYRFMQERMRYVGVQLGIGGWQPFSAVYVEQNRYGDCKALSNYMAAMLEEVGIISYPVLIYSGDDPSYEVREDFVTDWFNHMILYIPSQDMYLECTSNYLPTGYLSESTLDRNVLHITPAGGHLARTPTLEPTENGYISSQRMEILADGKAKLELNTNYLGGTHELFRYLGNELSHEELLEWLHEREYITDVSGKLALTLAEDKPEAILNFTTEVPRYARRMGKRLFVPLNKLNGFTNVPPVVSDRQLPVVSKSARFYVDSVYLKLPENMEIESLGENQIDIVHPAGEYHGSLAVQGRDIVWTSTLKLIPVELPASEYEGLREFYLAVSKADKRQIVLKVRDTR